jgi:hypothetical protein
MRRTKSILNKLTPEKFELLCTKLLESGLRAEEHSAMLAKVLFDEAVRGSAWLPMYADLCVRLFEHFGEQSWVLRDYLLEQCWMSFQMPIMENSDAEKANTQHTPTPESEDNYVAQQVGNANGDSVEDAGDGRKKRMLGSVRFMGELFVRSLLVPYGIITCCYDLLQYPLSADSVELAVAFLTVVGPVFDCPEWPHFDEFRSIFWDLRGMTFDQTLGPRVRFLLRDLLELRDHGWLHTRYATRLQGPKRLQDVRWEAAAESKPAGAELTPALNPAFQFCPLRSDVDGQMATTWMSAAETEFPQDVMLQVLEWPQDGEVADWPQDGAMLQDGEVADWSQNGAMLQDGEVAAWSHDGAMLQDGEVADWSQDGTMLQVPVPLSCH